MDQVILLDEKGKSISSIDFSNLLNQKLLDSTKRLVFVIGGAFGFSEEVYKRADLKLSFSKMTFSHQMIRLIFKEQLYRAFTILKGEKYHHE
jgi:23S rRNA (pseudouridine1915-N3)-methyltransferase